MEKVLFESSEEISAHLAALRHIAEADGQVTQTEENYLSNLTAIYQAMYPNLDISSVDSNIFDLNNLTSLFVQRRQKMLFLQDLFSMSCADGEMSDEEINTIRHIGESLDISHEHIDHLFELNKGILIANYNLSSYLLEDEKEVV